MKLPAFAGGTLTALKWLAVVLMVADHVDWLLLDNALGVHASLGRLVFPVFGWVIAYNLARPGAIDAGVHQRMLVRLAAIGAIAAPAYVYLAGWLPLNIMFTLSLLVAITWAIERGHILLAAAAFAVAGGFVDYQWFGLTFALGVWAAYRFNPAWIIAGLAGLAGLYVVNGNLAALWALPVLALASQLQLQLPRHQFAFYAVYPLHLAVLALAALAA